MSDNGNILVNLEILSDMLVLHGLSDRRMIALHSGIDALKKQIPIEVKNKVKGDAECPNCNHHVYYFQKHCVECGQALKWR